MSSYEISKSSLLSLKAEILRKEEDLTKAKQENVEKIKTIKKKSLELKNKGVEARHLHDLDDEEKDLLKLSRSKLEAKSKLYDQLSKRRSQNEEINRKYLVRFDKKERTSEQPDFDEDDAPDLPIDDEDEDAHNSDDYDKEVNPDDEWIEYTDCLGRTRKCLRKDLSYLMSKDADLKSLAEKRNQAATTAEPDTDKSDKELEETIEEKEVDRETQIAEEESQMISGDMRREMLRRQWEKEEEELRDKADIHYQNILFDEARQHGVGYYAFSKDEEERARQQEALKKLRIETEQQQKRAQDLKALREEQMAARMKAARNRRRGRLGLPPEEDEPTPDPMPVESDPKKDEEEKKKQEAEKLLAEARKRYVRPWDVGKEGASEFYEMSQEEWNEKRRKERDSEFAPPKFYSKREFSSMSSLERSVDDSDKSLRFSSKSSENSKDRKVKDINPYKSSKFYDEVVDKSCNFNDRLMEDHVQSASKNNLYDENHDYDLNINKQQKKITRTMPIPIVNELEEPDECDNLLAAYHETLQETSGSDQRDNSRKGGVEIAPPPTFEYYGPGEGRKNKKLVDNINISESIEAGLKFLRKQSERKRRRADDIF